MMEKSIPRDAKVMREHLDALVAGNILQTISSCEDI